MGGSNYMVLLDMTSLTMTKIYMIVTEETNHETTRMNTVSITCDKNKGSKFIIFS